MPKRKQNIEKNKKSKLNLSSSSINILSDDGLRHIFSFLSHKEWIKLERVCRKWRDILKDSWKYTEEIDMKEFDCEIPREIKYFSDAYSYLPYVAAKSVW